MIIKMIIGGDLVTLLAKDSANRSISFTFVLVSKTPNAAEAGFSLIDKFCVSRSNH